MFGQVLVTVQLEGFFQAAVAGVFFNDSDLVSLRPEDKVSMINVELDLFS